MRAIRAITYFLDLGLNIPIQTTVFVGEQVSNYVIMGRKNMALGLKRYTTKHGRAIVNKYESWLGRSPWEEFTAPGKGLVGKLHELLFVGFHEASRLANTNFLLGTITEEEFNNETITDKRLAELKLEMGRTRVIPGTKSLKGSTSFGSLLMQYKTWAAPILRTWINNSSKLIADLKSKPKEEALTSKEAIELYRN